MSLNEGGGGEELSERPICNLNTKARCKRLSCACGWWKMFV